MITEYLDLRNGDGQLPVMLKDSAPLMDKEPSHALLHTHVEVQQALKTNLSLNFPMASRTKSLSLTTLPISTACFLQ